MRPIFQKRRIHSGPRITDINRKVTDMSDEVVVAEKPWWKSRTIWTNLIGIGLIVAQYFGIIGAADIPAEYTVSGIFALIVNMALRFITERKLTLKKVKI